MKNEVSADTTQQERADLNVDVIIELLTTCLNTTYFQVGSKFYK